MNREKQIIEEIKEAWNAKDKKATGKGVLKYLVYVIEMCIIGYLVGLLISLIIFKTCEFLQKVGVMIKSLFKYAGRNIKQSLYNKDMDDEEYDVTEE